MPKDRTSFANKRKGKGKPKAIMFDEDSRKEYLTGFRKRKNERRKKANDQIKQKDKDRRKEEQAMKRKMVEERLEMIRNQRIETFGEEDDESTTNIEEHTEVFESENLDANKSTLVTAVIEPFDLSKENADTEVKPLSDSEEEKNDDEEEKQPVKRPFVNKKPSTNGNNSNKRKFDKNKPFSKKQNKRRN